MDQDFHQNSVKENIKENISSCGRQRLSAASALDAYKRKKKGLRAALPPLFYRTGTLTFLRASHTIAAEPTCSGVSRDSYLGSRIDCRQKTRGFGTRPLSLWGQSAIMAFRFSYEKAGASGDSCMALCGSFCVTAVESPDFFSSKGSGSPFTILWICDTLMVEGVPLEILAAGSPVWLLISSPSAEAVPLRDSPSWVPRRPVPPRGADPLSGKA